jgi:hypothetical protein
LKGFDAVADLGERQAIDAKDDPFGEGCVGNGVASESALEKCLAVLGAPGEIAGWAARSWLGRGNGRRVSPRNGSPGMAS